jgi:hypothetical protein
MNLFAAFRSGHGKRARNETTPAQPLRSQPVAVKELTQQELQQAQGGVHHQDIPIIKPSDKSS